MSSVFSVGPFRYAIQVVPEYPRNPSTGEEALWAIDYRRRVLEVHRDLEDQERLAAVLAGIHAAWSHHLPSPPPESGGHARFGFMALSIIHDLWGQAAASRAARRLASTDPAGMRRPGGEALDDPQEPNRRIVSEDEEWRELQALEAADMPGAGAGADAEPAAAEPPAVAFPLRRGRRVAPLGTLTAGELAGESKRPDPEAAAGHASPGAQCATCGARVAEGSVVNAPPRPPEGGSVQSVVWLVSRTLYCDACGHLQVWDQACTPGRKAGSVGRLLEAVYAPRFERDPGKVEEFLRRHPEARNVVTD